MPPLHWLTTKKLEKKFVLKDDFSYRAPNIPAKQKKPSPTMIISQYETRSIGRVALKDLAKNKKKKPPLLAVFLFS
ncbi:hypothetical protein FDE44_21695 [Vibrio parahaemolyticus]|nr:hypothetical protein [Vibrio parahaemolyticus]